MKNSDTGALAVTRDYPRILSVDILIIRIVAIFSRIRISRILSEDTIRIPVSVVNTDAFRGNKGVCHMFDENTFTLFDKCQEKNL